jgi:hypothetical protein
VRKSLPLLSFFAFALGAACSAAVAQDAQAPNLCARICAPDGTGTLGKQTVVENRPIDLLEFPRFYFRSQILADTPAIAYRAS